MVDTVIYSQYHIKIWLDYLKLQVRIHFNTFMLKSSSETAVWIYDKYENNLGSKIDFTKYLKESCW